jgi:hypothetical protein
LHAIDPGVFKKAPTFGSLIKRDVGASFSKNFGMVGAYADYRLNRVKTRSGHAGAEDPAKQSAEIAGSITGIDHDAKVGFEKIRQAESLWSGRVIERLDDISDEIDRLDYHKRPAGRMGRMASSVEGLQPKSAAGTTATPKKESSWWEKIKGFVVENAEIEEVVAGTAAIAAIAMPLLEFIGATAVIIGGAYVVNKSGIPTALNKTIDAITTFDPGRALNSGIDKVEGWLGFGPDAKNKEKGAAAMPVAKSLTYKADKITFVAKKKIKFTRTTTLRRSTGEKKPGGQVTSKTIIPSGPSNTHGGGSKPRTIVPSSQAQSGQHQVGPGPAGPSQSHNQSSAPGQADIREKIRQEVIAQNLAGQTLPNGKPGSVEDWTNVATEMVKRESGFNPKSFNPTDPDGGSRGFFQLGPHDAHYIGRKGTLSTEELENPDTNIKTGIAILKSGNGEKYFAKSTWEAAKNAPDTSSWKGGSRTDLAQPTSENGKMVPGGVIDKARSLIENGSTHADVQQFMRSQGYPMNGAWCGEFMASVVKSQGGSPPKDPQIASNWLKWGTHVDAADIKPGDNVIASRKPEYHGRLGTGQPGDMGGHVTALDPSRIDVKNHRFWSDGGNQGGAGWKSLDEYELRKAPASDAAPVAKQAAAPGAIKQPGLDRSGAIKLPPSLAVASPDQVAKAQALVDKYSFASGMINARAPGLIGPDGKVDPTALAKAVKENPGLATQYDLGPAPIATPVNTPPAAPDLTPSAAPAPAGVTRIVVHPRQDASSSQQQSFQPDVAQQQSSDGDPNDTAGRISFSAQQGMSQ